MTFAPDALVVATTRTEEGQKVVLVAGAAAVEMTPAAAGALSLALARAANELVEQGTKPGHPGDISVYRTDDVVAFEGKRPD